VIFAAGSFLAAAATDIWTTIAGRTLQGAGAISSVVVALAADLTREQHRTKTMAMIGAMIGFAFALSLVAAPALYEVIGMGGLFALTGILCIVAIGVVKTLVPDIPGRIAATPLPAAAALREAVLAPELLRVNFGIFVLHVAQMAMFVVLPVRLVGAGLELPAHWKLYLPVVLASFVMMLLPVLYADRRNRPKPVLIGSVLLLIAAQFALALSSPDLVGFGLLLLFFFIAFNVLEALLPSLVSRLAPARGRGTAIGVYNTTQTLGLFFGGLLGGWVAKNYGTAAVFAACALLSILWLAAAAGMRPLAAPVNELSSLTFSIAAGVNLQGLPEALARVRGVRDAEVLAHERIARLKVVPGEWDESRVRKLITGEV
jgi:MFS family permease